MIEKSRARPASGPKWRSSRWPVAWNVPPWTRVDADPTSRSARLEHLVGGAAREGEEEDALGRDAAFDEVGDAVDERARLPGAGAGDDEQRTVAVRGGGGLLGVQLRGEVAGGAGDVRSRAG